MDRLTATGQAFGTIAEAMYDDRCAIRRRVSTKAVDGGNLAADQIVASDVPIRITPSSAQEKEIAGATQGTTAYKVRMPLWHEAKIINLTSDCFLDVAARDLIPAQVLAVVGPLPRSGSVIDVVTVRRS